MGRLALLGITIFALLSTCVAQFQPCKFADASTIGSSEGITIWRVGLIEPTGEVEATVFVPQSEVPLPGIVFSHAAIHGATGNTDLRRFAFALAQAGASSIVLDGTIEWQIPNDESGRAPHLMACAGQWLLLHARLDRRRLANAGPHGGWGGGETPFCQAGESPCWPPGPWLNFGQTSAAEFRNTEDMLTLQGQLSMARFAQRVLKLREINPKWLTATADFSQK
ncbi:MAG: hypothetical protein WBC78_21320 [Candidatus Sulfotelmatobacter sp.]